MKVHLQTIAKRPTSPIATRSRPDSRNVDEGAFVDIGVKQDGLIHRSKLKGKRLSVGQVVDVEVLEVDERRGRISLGLT